MPDRQDTLMITVLAVVHSYTSAKWEPDDQYRFDDIPRPTVHGLTKALLHETMSVRTGDGRPTVAAADLPGDHEPLPVDIDAGVEEALWILEEGGHILRSPRGFRTSAAGAELAEKLLAETAAKRCVFGRAFEKRVRVVPRVLA